VSAATHVKAVAWLLLVIGGLSLLMGFLAAGALGRDVRLDGSVRQIAFGPALLLSGLLAVFAGRRNRRMQSRPLGLAALAVLGAVGLVCFKPLNPHTLLAAYGLAVYLSPGGRAAFR
jgi:hypothetical protein